MNVLDLVTETTVVAPSITIYGQPGIGKSTLASQFPSPLFIPTERTGLVGVKSLPIANTLDELWKNVTALLKEPELPFKTIVVDSVSKLDSLVVQSVLDSDPKKPSSINTACGGYGAGYAAAQLRHRALKGLFDKFNARGIAVVYVAHLATVKYRSPETEDYDQYSIVMHHDKSREVYVDDVDCVAFCRLKTFVTETDTGRQLAKTTGERIITVGTSPNHVSKNRFGMPVNVPMTFEAFAEHIPFFKQ